MQKREKPVVLVTAVGAPPGLNALRALHESEKYTLIAADADYRSPGLYQYGTRHVVLPLATETEKYLVALDALIREQSISVVLPCLEDEVLVMARAQAQIRKAGAMVLLPDEAIILATTDKGRAALRAIELGLPCPRSLVLRQPMDGGARRNVIDQFYKTVPPPWIVKPVWGHGMKGIERIEKVETMDSFIYSDEAFIVQEYIPGAIGSMYLVGLLYDKYGQLRREFTSRSIRTLFPDGGPATAGVSVRRLDIINYTDRLIQNLGGWRGPLNAEWMLDPRDGLPKFIEINPRLWGYGYLATGSGINFADCTAALALNIDIGSDPGFREGVTLLRSTNDLIFDHHPFAIKN